MSFPCLGQAGASPADRDRAASGPAAPSGLSDSRGSTDGGCAGAVMVTHTLSSACTQLRLVLGQASAVGQLIGRAQAEEALAREALHDPRTSLPNRTLLHDRLQQAILVARRDGTSLSFLLMDLDRFKEVNDTFGHHYGDLLLQQLAA